MSDAADRLSEVQAKIADAATRAQRRAEDICLIAVSKTHDAAAIRPLIAAGQRHFGENRVQEAAAKWPELRAETPDVMLHLIGQQGGLTIDGLMAIPPADIEPAPFFALLDELAERNRLPGRSMGMSGDYETAVMLGATHVRVGTALFGAR